MAGITASVGDLPEDFYGLTPSYTQPYLRLNSRETNDMQSSNYRVYSTGLIQGDFEYYVGLTGGSGPTYSEADWLKTDPVEDNTIISEASAGINTGPNGSIDSKYFVNIGDGNTITGIKTSFVLGNNNTVNFGNENVAIIGGVDNEIGATLTQSVLINGTGKIVNMSDITVLDGKPVLSTRPVQTIVHIVEGELNPHNQYIPFQVIEGGKDTVRPLHSRSIVTVVESDTSVFFTQK